MKMKKLMKKLLILCLPLFLVLSCGNGTKTTDDTDFSDTVPDMDDEGDNEPETPEENDRDIHGNDSDNDTKPKYNPCDKKPCARFKVTSTGVCIPDEDGGYSCQCRENYVWDGKCCSVVTRTEECAGLPKHAHWTANSAVTQKLWDGEWIPPAQGDYSWSRESTSTVCHFLCDENYFWTGSECINPCDAEPCRNVPHSDGVCSSVGVTLYTCGCEENYYWWGERRGCSAQKVALGNICSGQNECYDNLNEIECPAESDAGFFGQEAHYAKLGVCSPLDITVDSSNPEEPVVISRNTGLMWQKNIAMEGYTLENAAAHCEKIVYAGYDDWRLPSVHELASIMASNKYMVEYNRTFFNFFREFMQESGYIVFWASDSDIYSPGSARLLNFYDNRIGLNSETEIGAAICVRGEKMPEAEFETLEINGDEVVTDSSTGLMWQKNPGRESAWKQALNYCENLVYAGYSDWRLPDRNELLSLFSYRQAHSAFPDVDGTASPAWSSTTFFNGITSNGFIDSGPSSSAINLYNGTLEPETKSDKPVYTGGTARCVRSEICPEGYFLSGLECIKNPCKPEFCEVADSTGLCLPETETDYECRCLEGFFWNGFECVNPCGENPCSKIPYSDGICTAVNSNLYLCGCREGSVWTGDGCAAFAANVKTLGSICTGQNKCYDNAEKIDCSGMKQTPFAGQDAFYANIGRCLKQDFTVKKVSQQNIVADNNTKLEWQQAYPQKAVSWNTAYTYCSSLEYAGKSDWRLPTPQEIMTLVDYGRERLKINSDYFTEIPESASDGRNFWTDKASVLDFDKGHTFSYASKDDIYFVMCVRGGTLPTVKLEVSASDGGKTAVDLTTGLVWTIDAFQAETWENALSLCHNLTYAGKTGWRLPNKNELASLVGADGAFPPEFSDIGTDFWSSTTYQYQTNLAVKVNVNGDFDYIDKTGAAYPVVCVGRFE